MAGWILAQSEKTCEPLEMFLNPQSPTHQPVLNFLHFIVQEAQMLRAFSLLISQSRMMSPSCKTDPISPKVSNMGEHLSGEMRLEQEDKGSMQPLR